MEKAFFRTIAPAVLRHIVYVLRRLGARAIDQLLVHVVFYKFLLRYMPFDLILKNGYPGKLFLAQIIFYSAILLYFGIGYKVFGTTVGKRVVGLRVTTKDFQKISLPQTFLRVLFNEGYILATPIVALVDVGWLRFAATTTKVYNIIDDGFLLFNPKRRCIHDYIASTVVVPYPRPKDDAAQERDSLDEHNNVEQGKDS
ncbi:MAG: RDD family protein [Planctomycetes bacterium]|nr:RDD family protein [Planctomycetota bacterium]